MSIHKFGYSVKSLEKDKIENGITNQIKLHKIY